MYLIKKTYENTPEFLKSADFQNVSCTVSDEGVAADEDGKKIVPAGSFLDKDGVAVHISQNGSVSSVPVGILFSPVDVTCGPQPGALMIDGSVNTERLPEEYAADAVQELIPKMPHIKFFIDGQMQVAGSAAASSGSSGAGKA